MPPLFVVDDRDESCAAGRHELTIVSSASIDTVSARGRGAVDVVQVACTNPHCGHTAVGFDAAVG